MLISILLLSNDQFVVDARTSTTYTVELSRDALRGFVDDIGLFERHMPGVIGVKPMGNQTYLYQTEKEIPLAGTMSTNFLIKKIVVGDSMTVYQSVDIKDQNYMFCSVKISPRSTTTTDIHISLRLRLSRDAGSQIHWLAPVFGEGFIEDRMKSDMDKMLEAFIVNSNKELYAQLGNRVSLN